MHGRDHMRAPRPGQLHGVPADAAGGSHDDEPLTRRELAELERTDELRANYAITRRWQPRMQSDERADGVAAWHRAVDRTLGLVDTERETAGALSSTKT